VVCIPSKIYCDNDTCMCNDIAGFNFVVQGPLASCLPES